MGDFGTGKTAFATSAGSQTEVLDFDNGMATCEYFKDQWTNERKQAIQYPCYMEDPNSASNWRRAKGHVLDICNAARSPAGYKRKIIVIDSFSTAGEAAVRNVREGLGNVKDYARFNPFRIQDWGTMVGEFEQMIQLLRMTPLIVICIAHVEVEEVDGGKKRLKPIAGTQRFAGKVAAYFDEVWQAVAKDEPGGKTGYYLQTQQTEGRPARSRRGLPNMTPMNLGLKKILSMIGTEI